MLNYFIGVMGILVFLRVFIFVFKSWPDEGHMTKTKPALHINGYELFYSDQKSEDKIEGVIYAKLLHSDIHNISGKPDYIYRKKNGTKLIPVELKSGVIGDSDTPRQGDLMQLVAYFIIIEDVYGLRPKQGRLIYKDYMFIIKNTQKVRKELLAILWDMRDMLQTGEGEANNAFVQCKHCLCRETVCEYC